MRDASRRIGGDAAAVHHLGDGCLVLAASRGPAGFAREQLRRLGVPLLVGLLTLVPLQVWLGLRHSGDPAAGPGFYRRCWDVRPSLNFPFVVEAALGGLFETGHLWFLVCLLGFSLVLLPGLRLLDRAHGQGPAAVLAVAFRLLKTLDGLLWVVAILGLAGSRRARPRTPTAPACRVGAYLTRPCCPSTCCTRRSW